MGGTAKEQMGELKKAFKAIISPTALVVIALIAGGVALARWAFKALGATTETDQLTNAIEVLEGISSSATSSLDTLTLDTKELAEKFGDAGLKARQLARDIALLTQAELRQAMMKSFTLLGDEIDGFLFNKLSLSLQKSISKSAKSLNTDPLREAFVSKVTPIFESLASNTLTFVEQEAAVGSLIETYTRFGVSMEGLPAPILKVGKQLLNLSSLALSTKRDIERALEIDPAAPPPASKDDIAAAKRFEKEQERLEEAQKQADEQVLLELERINELNDTKLETEEKFHQDRLAVIEEAGAKGLITEEEANRFSEDENERHQDKMAAIDREVFQSRLRMAAGFFGTLATIFEGGSSKMLKISKIFGAAQALVNAWIAFSEVLADPRLAWYERIPLALVALAAGLKAVQAIQSVGKGGSGSKSVGGGGAAPASAGQVAPAETSNTTAVNINVRGQVFDRGAVIGLIEQINEAIGDGARIRAT